MLTRRTALAWGALCIAAQAAPLRAVAQERAQGQAQEGQAAPTVDFGITRLRFASEREGREVLGADDDWVEATGEFYRRAMLGVNSPVSLEKLRAFSADTVLPWAAAQQARWTRAMTRVAPRLRELGVALPPEVLLISSNGRDSANAPYTRRNAIVMPAKALPDNPDLEAFVFAHELFHVVSRRSPALATRLYALIGFEATAPLEWPQEWLPLRIANPDAPHDRHLMRTTLRGRELSLMPLLVMRRAELKPGESFFDVLEIRLLEVSTDGAKTMPVRREGQPVWHVPADVPDYLARLGGNTQYIFHPEETVADNFALLVTGRSVPNPGLLKRFAAALQNT
jgi:hypothetical protein